MSSPNPFGGVTMAQAAAGLSALTCPAGHRNAVPVEDLLGERVATLCPDCDQQLPAEWKTSALPPFEPDPTLTRRFKQ